MTEQRFILADEEIRQDSPPRDWVSHEQSRPRPAEWSPGDRGTSLRDWTDRDVHVDPMVGLSRVLDDGRWILDLKDNWDQEGASEYSRATYLRALAFVERLFEKGWDVFGRALPEPVIAPADEGSIDLFWELDERNLLLNIPVDAAPTYYGEDRRGGSLGGTIGSESRVDLVAWLLRYT